MNNLLEQHCEELISACAAAQVDALYAFGSILADHFSAKTDKLGRI